eukprot:15202830-Alexandrium_andersonii.AAC.1
MLFWLGGRARRVRFSLAVQVPRPALARLAATLRMSGSVGPWAPAVSIHERFPDVEGQRLLNRVFD